MPLKQSQQLRRFNYLLGEQDAVYHAMSLHFGISDSISMILYALYGEGGALPIADIIRLYGLTKQTVNSALRRLEAEGKVTLESVSGRSKRVRLTAEGDAFCEKTVAQIIAAENEVLASWSKEESEQYLALTERFIKQMKEKSEKMK